MEREFGGNLFMKLTEVMLVPPELSQFERFRNFFDRSLFTLFAPAIYILIGVLSVFLSLFALKIENIIIRYVLLLLIASIVAGAVISAIAYTTHLPINSILGIFIHERYISNVLAGVYFGTQVVRWVFSLYFYDESSEHSQSSYVIKLTFVLFILVCFVPYLPILWRYFY